MKNKGKVADVGHCGDLCLFDFKFSVVFYQSISVSLCKPKLLGDMHVNRRGTRQTFVLLNVNGKIKR
jgi:hypothetical protein